MSGPNITLLIVLAVAGAAVWIVTRANFRWTFLSGTLMSMVLYGAHLTIGFVLFILLVDAFPESAGYLGIVLFGWIGLGALDLIRVVPRTREPPRFLMTPGKADAFCLMAMAIGLAMAWIQ